MALGLKISDKNKRMKEILGRLSAEDCRFICEAICSDPLTGVYWILSIIYVLILGCFLLWPYDFYLFEKNNARWLKNPNGIEFLKTGQAVSNSYSQEFFDRIQKGGGLTLELWLQTEDLNQAGPARIISYSKNTGIRNFTIGQSQDKLVVRLRTTETNLNGTNPHFVIDDAFNDRGLQHMAIIYDFLEQRVYINGEQKVRRKTLKGTFSNWDPNCRLVIGNEATGDRPWKGKIYYAAVFDRALTEQEIRQNYLLGLRLKTNKERTKHTLPKDKGPIIRYLFDEGKGDIIHDDSLISNHVNLLIPKYIKRNGGHFLSVSFAHSQIQSKNKFSHLTLNIFIFIPLGIFIHGMLRTRYGITLKISLATLLAGALLTIGFESLQHLTMTRDSSLIDVSINMAGIFVGVVIDRGYNLLLDYKAKHLQKLVYDHKKIDNGGS
jgi:VanZ family protein